jgi:hypothetical protein
VKQAAFDARILELWTTTRLPLTRANIVAVTGVSAKQADAWLDVMVKDELLDVDSNDNGDLLWAVRGSERPARGLQTAAEVLKMQSLRKEIERPADENQRTAMTVASAGPKTKSVLVSTGLCFFLGPLGLLYAAPLSVALPAALVWLIVLGVVPTFILVYVAGILYPITAVAGALYAWGYNRAGRRVPLLGGERPSARKLLRR